MITTERTIGCVKAATDVLGNKWTPQLLRYLANEKSVRFCHLQDLVGGINPRTLSARLAHLEEEDIIEKTNITSPKRVKNYFQFFVTWNAGALITIVANTKYILSIVI